MDLDPDQAGRTMLEGLYAEPEHGPKLRWGAQPRLKSRFGLNRRKPLRPFPVLRFACYLLDS
jgi:hypothetical protein